MIYSKFDSIKYVFIASILFLIQNHLIGVANPTVVSDSYGNSFYVEILPATSDSGQEIQATYKPFDSDWQAPEKISGGFLYRDGFKVQMDREGNVVVAWIGFDSPNETYALYSNTWVASKKYWIGASQVSNIGKELQSRCSISVSEGKTLMVWSEYDDNMKPVTYVNELISDQWHHSSTLRN